MKQLTNHQAKEKRQNMRSKDECLTGAHGKTILLKPTTSRSNIFMIQNIGKDPPGRSRSPGAAYYMDPDHPSSELKYNNNLLITEFQIFKQIRNPNFLTINFLQS